MFDTMNRLKLMAKPDEVVAPVLKIENLAYLADETVELVPFSPVTLNLTGNYLAHLPITLARQTQVKRLLLSKNRFTALQQGVMAHIGQSLQHVVELDLTDNDLRYLALDGFRSLRTLRLASNRLSELPPTLSKMTDLALLNVSRNSLTALPERLPISLTIVGT